MTRSREDLETRELRKRLSRRALIIASLLVGPPLIVVILLFAIVTAFSVTTVEKELRRVSSPDSKTDAVLVYYGGGGAAGWDARGLYLTSADADAEEGALLLDSPHLGTSTQIQRRDGRLLEIGTAAKEPREENVRLEDDLGNAYTVQVEVGPVTVLVRGPFRQR